MRVLAVEVEGVVEQRVEAGGFAAAEVVVRLSFVAAGWHLEAFR